MFLPITLSHCPCTPPQYAINFPLHDGMDDGSFTEIFRAVLAKVMETYQPGAVVLQCGADSLSGDRLGCFNLSVRGHADCVAFMRSFNVPMLVLGGGGYTLRNVPRCWTFETSVLLGHQIEDALPFNDYFEYYGPDYRLLYGHVSRWVYFQMVATRSVVVRAKLVVEAPIVLVI